MADVLARDPEGLELVADPTALAPERLLVFELRGSVAEFANAVAKVPGLELIDEEELEGDEDDKVPFAYLLVPDARALHEILRLWKLWLADRELGTGFTPWRDVFYLLRSLRLWGPEDRVRDEDRGILAEEISERHDDDLLKLELELVFRTNPEDAAAAEAKVRRAVVAAGGRGIHRSYLEDIAYHALLVELPVRAIRSIIERSASSIAGLDSVQNIRPQSLVSSIDVAELSPATKPPSRRPDRSPILALLDGVPISEHPLLAGRLSVDDLFDLDDDTAPAVHREHDTAMASLITLGDRNRREAPLPRRIHMVPVMSWNGSMEAPPENRLIVDLIYRAIFHMRADAEPSAPDVLIVNLSLGNPRMPFHGHMSAWARLLDRLAWQFGLLFIVSAGNIESKFFIPAYDTKLTFDAASEKDRAANTLRAVNGLMAQRRIIAPAETVNGLTVGAVNHDDVSTADRLIGYNLNPYPNLSMANPSSRLGPGFANSVKPEILMPGAREHLRVWSSGDGLEVAPLMARRAFGLKVAAPPALGNEAQEGYTSGTSAAAALASRTAHRIHDALEDAFGAAFIGLSPHYRAVILKALLVHPARWPEDAANLIRDTVGPADNRQHVRQKDNIRRFLGYGVVDGEDAVACAADRATFWAAGQIEREQSVVIDVPIPLCMGGQAKPHALWATLAWFTPARSGRNRYRAVRLSLQEPDDLSGLQVQPAKAQPDSNQSKRGTVISRRWDGEKAPVVIKDMAMRLVVQREPDTGAAIDDPVPFGLAVTLAMPGAVEIYEQIRQRLAIPDRGISPLRAAS